MRSRALCLAMVLLGALVFSQGSARAAATDPPWGFHDYLWGRQYPAPPVSDTDALVQASYADGASIDRLLVGWAWVEPTNDVYDWRTVDPVYRAMAARGIRPVVTVYAAPSWATEGGLSCADCSFRPDSTHYGDWRSFVQVLMKHLQALDAEYPGFQGTKALEIWNEPNITRFFYPKADAAAYVQLLSRTRKAAAAAGFTKPIVSGGIGPVTSAGEGIDPDTYLSRMYSHKFGSYVDGVGIHPTAHGSSNLVADMNTASHYGFDTLDSIRNQHKDSHPFWVTKIGVSSNPCSVPDCSGPQDPWGGVNGATAQGNVLVNMYNSLATRPVRAVIIFSFEDANPPDIASTWGGYGVVDTSGGSIVAKQSYCVLGTQLGNGNPGYGC
jgi:hypothetical protein